MQSICLVMHKLEYRIEEKWSLTCPHLNGIVLDWKCFNHQNSSGPFEAFASLYEAPQGCEIIGLTAHPTLDCAVVTVQSVGIFVQDVSHFHGRNCLNFDRCSWNKLSRALQSRKLALSAARLFVIPMATAMYVWKSRWCVYPSEVF